MSASRCNRRMGVHSARRYPFHLRFAWLGSVSIWPISETFNDQYFHRIPALPRVQTGCSSCWEGLGTFENRLASGMPGQHQAFWSANQQTLGYMQT
eukprot:6205176-Pleurochrysis_carterae.AAC.4